MNNAPNLTQQGTMDGVEARGPYVFNRAHVFLICFRGKTSTRISPHVNEGVCDPRTALPSLTALKLMEYSDQRGLEAGTG